MTKRLMFAAPFMAAVAFVCQPMMAEDQATGAADRAANQADRALDQAGNEVNRAADQAGNAADAAGDAAAGVAADAQQAGARQQGQAAQLAKMSKDQRFVWKTADMDMFEIQSSQLAQQKSQDDQIKQAAQRIMDDHTKSSERLMKIAQSKNMQVPSSLSPVHQAMLQELSQMEGKDFDRAYLYGQVAGHQKAVLKFRDASQELQDEELKAFAVEMLPKLREHKMHVDQLAGVEQEATAGAREHGSGDHGDAGSGTATPNGGQAPGSGAGEQQTPEKSINR